MRNDRQPEAIAGQMKKVGDLTLLTVGRPTQSARTDAKLSYIASISYYDLLSREKDSAVYPPIGGCPRAPKSCGGAEYQTGV